MVARAKCHVPVWEVPRDAEWSPGKEEEGWKQLGLWLSWGPRPLAC